LRKCSGHSIRGPQCDTIDCTKSLLPLIESAPIIARQLLALIASAALPSSPNKVHSSVCQGQGGVQISGPQRSDGRSVSCSPSPTNSGARRSQRRRCGSTGMLKFPASSYMLRSRLYYSMHCCAGFCPPSVIPATGVAVVVAPYLSIRHINDTKAPNGMSVRQRAGVCNINYSTFHTDGVFPFSFSRTEVTLLTRSSMPGHSCEEARVGQYHLVIIDQITPH
jgi:hypothetical protein